MSSGVQTSARDSTNIDPNPAETVLTNPLTRLPQPETTPIILTRENPRPIVFDRAAEPHREEIDQRVCAQTEIKIPQGPSLWVPLVVGTEKTWSLIDTGASSNLICKRLQEKVGGKLEAYNGRVIDPKGDPMPILGVTRVRMNVAGLQTTEKFLVMDGLNPDVIVGLRYLLERGCRLDWEHCCLWLEGGIRKAPMTVAGPQIPCDPDPVLTLCAEINGDTPLACVTSLTSWTWRAPADPTP